MLRRLVIPSAAALAAAAGLYLINDTPAAAGAGGPAGQEAFTPREVTPADIPPDVREDSWARLPTVRRETLDAEGRRVFDIIVNPESRYASGLRGPSGCGCTARRWPNTCSRPAPTCASARTARATSGWRSWPS